MGDLQDPAPPLPVVMTKAEARAWARTRRLARPQEQVSALSEAACRHALGYLIKELSGRMGWKSSLPPAQDGLIVMTYILMPGKGEADPTLLITGLMTHKLVKEVVVPVVTGAIEAGGRMEAYPLSPSHDLELDSRGLPLAPVGVHPVPTEDIGVVIVPMLAGDQQGHRVGYGKGYFDAYLSRLARGTLTIGLCLEPPLDHLSDIAHWDRPLRAMAWPGGVITP